VNSSQPAQKIGGVQKKMKADFNFEACKPKPLSEVLQGTAHKNNIDTVSTKIMNGVVLL
jgi:hypothetical protein